MNKRSLDLLANWVPGDGHVHSKYSTWDFAYMRVGWEPSAEEDATDRQLVVPADLISGIPEAVWKRVFIAARDKPSVSDMAKAACKRSLEWIALTDHETMFLSRYPGVAGNSATDPNKIWARRKSDCAKASNELGLLILVGEELGGCDWSEEVIVELSRRYGIDVLLPTLKWILAAIGNYDRKSYGHCLCYGADGYISSGAKLTCSNMLAAAGRQSQAFFLAHPGDDPDNHYDIPWADFRAGHRDASAGYHGVEVLNHTLDWYARRPADDEESMWDRHLTQELADRAKGELPKTRHVALGNSDAHWDGRTDHETNYPGKDFTWVHSPNGVTQPDILAAMRDGRCVASQSIENHAGWWVALGPLVACRLVCGDRSAEIGGTITVPRDTDVDLEIEWASHADLEEILVVGAHGRHLLSVTALPAATVRDGYDYLRAEWKPIVDRLAAKGLSRISAHTQVCKLRFAEPGYVRLIASTQGDPPKRAFTNPIWVMVT